MTQTLGDYRIFKNDINRCILKYFNYKKTEPMKLTINRECLEHQILIQF